ncbi:MAG: hypothetical protein OIF32_03905, partial [Campylobacterales bacterium]|nr:hypothetical protein [Campylobacterales bacterium]
DLENAGVSVHKDEDPNSVVFQIPVQEKTLSELDLELRELQQVDTDVILNLLNDYLTIVKKYNISIVRKLENSSNPFVYKSFFPKEIAKKTNTLIPLIGKDGINIFNSSTITSIVTSPKVLNYSISLDSNIVSYLERYFQGKEVQVDESFSLLIAQKVNFDITPYLVEQFIVGYENMGKSFRLNDKSKAQEGIFKNIEIVHKNLPFLIRDKEEFIKEISSYMNNQAMSFFRYYNINRLTLIILLKSRILFPSKGKKSKAHIMKRKEYILESLTNLNVPLSNRLLKLILLFWKDDNYEFFNKVRTYAPHTKEKKYLENISNTARDMLICTLPSTLSVEKVFPILYTKDKALAKAFEDMQPDYILNINVPNHVNQDNHVYCDFQKEYYGVEELKKFFTEESHKKRMTYVENFSFLFSNMVKKEEKELIELLKR